MKYKFLTKNQGVLSDFKEFLSVWNDEGDIIQQKTSGSTGKPKLIEIPKWKLKASAEMTGKFFKLRDLNKSLLCISSKFIGGKMMIVRSILFDLELIITDVSSNPIKNLNEKVDFAAMVPLQVDTILRENPEKLDLIKYLIIGGAPVSSDLEERLQNSQCEAYSTYGMTETVSHVALKKLGGTNPPFKAIGETNFKTFDDELLINAPDLKTFDLKTNDIVNLIDEKQFHWKGRKDFVINTGGIKIQPEEIEQQIKNQIKISNFIISSVPDVTYGQKVIIICEEDAFDKVENFISNWNLNNFAKPRAIYVIDQIPLTQNGKIDRIATLKKIEK